MTITKENVHLITSVQRRRRWTAEEKRTIVQETFLPGMNLSITARKHGRNPSQLFQWRRLMEEGVVSKGYVRDLERRVRELERMLGRKTLENEILRETVKLGREKKLISQQPLYGVEGME